MGTGEGGALPEPETYLEVRQGHGAGYAISTEAELAVVQRVCAESGVILDPVSLAAAVPFFFPQST